MQQKHIIIEIYIFFLWQEHIILEACHPIIVLQVSGDTTRASVPIHAYMYMNHI